VKDAVEWLFRQQQRGIHPGLDRMRALLARLRHPERAFRAVQVGGTNGKGSVTRMLSSMLIEAHRLQPGTRWGPVGEYTSPHLHRFAERVLVDGTEISSADFERIVANLKVIHEDVPATFFELITALALEHFRNAGVSWALLEVGLGGRLDATTAVPAELCVITNVAFDHMNFLGDTLPEIAFEKAGILRPGVGAVTGATGMPLEVIQARASELNVPLWVLGQDIRLEYSNLGLDGLEVTVETPSGTVESHVGLRGDHQASNAALAVAAAQQLGVPVEAIARGLERVYWPGRLEFVPGRLGQPGVLVDAAHNPDGAHALARFVRGLAFEPITLIVAGMADKDLEGVASALRSIATNVIATRPQHSPRAATPEIIARHYLKAHVTDTVEDALKMARGITSSDGLIVVAGTIPLAAQALEVLRGVKGETRVRLQ
jgi:dihydrofolate synthase/folylpolyglutamate synthase